MNKPYLSEEFETLSEQIDIFTRPINDSNSWDCNMFLMALLVAELREIKGVLSDIEFNQREGWKNG